jgi:hypothetical protein
MQNSILSLSMRMIPLNLLTLYADLAQRVSAVDVPAASITRRMVGGQRRIYATFPGGVRKQVYLGTAGDPKAEARAIAHIRAADDARANRKTVTTLKRAGVPAPDLYTGRILAALAQGALFERGVVLVGTAAFQLYPCVVGAYLSSAIMTQDVDLSIARLAVPGMIGSEPLEVILRRADSTFEGIMSRTDKLPKKFRSAKAKFEVDIVTTPGRSPEPVLLSALGCSAEPLAFMDYLIEDAMSVVALYGAGVLVRVPMPERFAVHKLIVSQMRPSRSVKRVKDVEQARQLIAALRSRDPESIENEIEEARARGPTWRKRIDTALKTIDQSDDQA